jgi:hypothetical protein
MKLPVFLTVVVARSSRCTLSYKEDERRATSLRRKEALVSKEGR